MPIPTLEAITESPTLNRYAYANGDPVSYIDPYGMSAEYAKLSERGPLALDMLSLIPAAGNVFDLANGIWFGGMPQSTTPKINISKRLNHC